MAWVIFWNDFAQLEQLARKKKKYLLPEFVDVSREFKILFLFLSFVKKKRKKKNQAR